MFLSILNPGAASHGGPGRPHRILRGRPQLASRTNRRGLGLPSAHFLTRPVLLGLDLDPTRAHRLGLRDPQRQHAVGQGRGDRLRIEAARRADAALEAPEPALDAAHRSLDLEVVAARTPGFAGAELANVINEAALLAARRDKSAVGMAELEEAIDRVSMGLERRSRVITPEERRRVAYHELGHALVALACPHADPVHRVSIVPRGVAALGVTQQLPPDDRYLISQPDLEDRLAVMMGGRAAERLVFGKLSSGAANELQQATALARRMVEQFGMSSRVGPVAISTPATFLSARSSTVRPASPAFSAAFRSTIRSRRAAGASPSTSTCSTCSSSEAMTCGRPVCASEAAAAGRGPFP